MDEGRGSAAGLEKLKTGMEGRGGGAPVVGVVVVGVVVVVSDGCCCCERDMQSGDGRRGG